MIYKAPAIAILALIAAGCSGTGPVERPQTELSAKRLTGEQHEITLFRRFFNKEAEEQASREIQLINDPEYQEFLEWRQWKRFKAYQEWKRQNSGAS